MAEINQTQAELLSRIATSDTPRELLKAPELKKLYAAIGTLPPEERGGYGKQINDLKKVLEQANKTRGNGLS